MPLRPYQQDVFNKIKLNISKGYKSLVVVAPCGFGKSWLIAEICQKASLKNSKVLFLVHRLELCKQIEETLLICGVNLKNIDIQMVQTFSRRLKNINTNYDIIIVDEAHFYNKAYERIFNKYLDTIKIGMTATPERLTSGGLGNLFETIIEGVSTQWLIDNNYLAPYRYFSIPIVETNGLKIKNGEYLQTEVTELMSNVNYGELTTHYEKLAIGKRTIVYTTSIENANKIKDEFLQKNISCNVVSSQTPKNERETALSDFRSGKIDIIVNVDLLGVGISVNECDCVILARPTLSLALYIQQSMRAMRYLPNKEALIIDMVGNVFKHGMPCELRHWSLEQKVKKEESEIRIRECAECFAVYKSGVSKCPYCGAEAKTEKVTKNKKTINVDLVELERTNKIKETKIQDAHFKTWDEIVEFQKLHKYKFNWSLRTAIYQDIEIPSKYYYGYTGKVIQGIKKGKK